MASGKRRQARRETARKAAPVKESGITKNLLPLPEKPKTPPPIQKRSTEHDARRAPCPRDMTPSELKRALSETKSRLQTVERRLQVFIELVRHELDNRGDGLCKNAIRTYCDIETRHQAERETERQRHVERVRKYYEWLQQQGETP